jgi:hypothetical protein
MSPLDSNNTRFSFHHLHYHHHTHRWQSSCQPRPMHRWSIHQTMHSHFERGQLHALVRFVLLALHNLHYFPNHTYQFLCLFIWWILTLALLLLYATQIFNFLIIMHRLQKKCSICIRNTNGWGEILINCSKLISVNLY